MIRSPLHTSYWKSHRSHGFIFGEKVTIYWVDITDIDSSIDPYEYAIEKAVKYHNVKYDEDVSDENTFASEPFSRYESEFTYVK